jgi:hypothetical protein
MSPRLAQRSEKDKQEIESDLDEMIIATMRSSALANTIAFLAVVGLSFGIVILVLVAISGG